MVRQPKGAESNGRRNAEQDCGFTVPSGFGKRVLQTRRAGISADRGMFSSVVNQNASSGFKPAAGDPSGRLREQTMW